MSDHGSKRMSEQRITFTNAAGFVATATLVNSTDGEEYWVIESDETRHSVRALLHEGPGLPGYEVQLWVPMRESIHVYENSVIDLVVAESPEHAAALMAELTSEPYDAEYCGEFRQLPDEQIKTIVFDDESDARQCGTAVKATGRADIWAVTQTCAEWAKGGPGMIGSTEY